MLRLSIKSPAVIGWNITWGLLYWERRSNFKPHTLVVLFVLGQGLRSFIDLRIEMDNLRLEMVDLNLAIDGDDIPNYTLFVNDTDREIEIEYDDSRGTVKPRGCVHVRWHGYDQHETLNSQQIRVVGVELDQKISIQDLFDNIEITIFKDVDTNHYPFQTLSGKGHYSFRTLSEDCLKEDLEESLDKTMSSANMLLSKMEGLLNKVKIWRNQCQNLLEKYQERVSLIVRRLQIVIEAAGNPRLLYNFQTLRAVRFIHSILLSSLLEGEAMLFFCSGEDNYTKAAFALSLPPSSVPTFSRFALVLRELNWILDFVFYFEAIHVHGQSSFGNWKWCEKRCRLTYDQQNISKFGAIEDESLEDDDRRQVDDRKALETSQKFKSNWFWTRNPFQEKLEAIWRKRLLTPSHPPGPDRVPDCFWIESPDDNSDFKFVKHLSNGASKIVDRSKWLGETVAVAMMTITSKQQLVAEAGLLARVQHPNVVELMGCAYKKESDSNHSKGFLVTELMEQDLESLIHQHERRSFGSGKTRAAPPFDLPVAVDIASQIVEAMIHLKECGVIHRDLKPSNCLASPKYQEISSPPYSDVPIYYTIKLTDFGTAKLRGQDSLFHTYKQGTPFYMAPELYGRPEEQWPYTWSADVYSFGMTCYKIFTGRDPFEKSTRFAMVQDFISRGQRPVFTSEFPTRLKEVIERCWTQNPSNRPSFEGIRKDLWQFKVDAFFILSGGAHELNGRLIGTDLYKLETEFKRLLSEQSHPCQIHREMPPREGGSSTSSSESDNLVSYPSEVLQRLQVAITKLAHYSARYNSCYAHYIVIRGAFCDDSLQALGVSYMDNITPDSVNAIPGEDLQRMTNKWVEQLEVIVKILYAGERRLAHQVFKNVGQTVAGKVLRLLTEPGIDLFLRFGESVAASERSPEKLCNLLQMYESMEDCDHSVIQVFHGEACGEIRARYGELLKQVVYAAGKTFWEIDDWVKGQQEDVGPDGRVMRLCSWVFNYLKYVVAQFPETLSKVLRIAQSWEGAEAQEKGLAQGIVLILQTLEGLVEARAQEFDNPALRHIFLMNNMYYICNRMKNSDLGPLLGEDQILDVGRKVSQNAFKYQREGWQPVLQHLNREGPGSSIKYSRDLVRQRLRTFTAAFDEAFQAQSKWIIPGQDLRDGTVAAIIQMVIPAYRNFLGLFGALLEGRLHDSEKYIKYSPEVMETMLGNLFTGNN